MEKHKYSSKKMYNDLLNQIIPLYGENEARQLSKMLLEDHLKIPFEKIMIDEEVAISSDKMKVFQEKVNMIKAYKPIQYVLEKANFYGRDFYVDSNVLIPRQETEELINEVVLDNKKEELSILDIGSGSGCIGITLGLELRNSQISSLDVSKDALKVTARNAKNYNVAIACVHGDILEMEKLPEKYDIIVSNPPYVTESEKQSMSNNVLLHEPDSALFVSDNDPLLFYSRIITLAKKSLKAQGKLYFEINEHFGHEMLEMCHSEGCTNARLIQDINGKDRIVKMMFS